MKRPARVVLDTNIVLSALLSTRGHLAAVRAAWQSGRCLPLVSATTVAELLRLLAYPKFKLTPDDRHELLADYLPFCTVVRMPVKLPRTPACRDPFDLPFLQLALAGKADFLVSGDKDLLSLARGFACPIVTVGKLLEILDV